MTQAHPVRHRSQAWPSRLMSLPVIIALGLALARCDGDGSRPTIGSDLARARDSASAPGGDSSQLADAPSPSGDVGLVQDAAHADVGSSPKKDVGLAKKDVASPKKDVASPKKDVASPKKDVASPKKDVASPKKDVAPPKNDVGVAKDAAKPKTDVAAPKKDVGLAKDAPKLSPDSGAACGSCHGMPPSTGRHSLHVSNQGLKCSSCHGCVVNSSQNIISTTLHQNGSKNVCGTLTWNAGTKQCSNVGCHGTKTW